MQAENKFIYKEEAIPLITLNTETNKFVINEEAITFLNSIKGNIGVISVAGLYRTGKSYLLNRMILDRANGFGVGPSINPCTKGLWVWGTPITGQTANGEPIQVLIIDSEGIGALDQDSAHDNRIFSLTVLLSSCFIYNSSGSIDENAIQNLSVIVNITKNIQIKSQPGDSSDRDPEEYSKYFPSFNWVLRDFALQLIDSQGEQLTPKEYLERSLAIQKGSSENIEQKNRIRKLLKTYFKERDCFTLVRPLINEENLQNLDKVGLDQLRPEFSRQVISLRRQILNNIKPKAINNKNLNGNMYIELIQSYVGAINNGAVPNIENTWSLICKTECRRVMQSAIETYDGLLKDVLNHKLPLPVEELKNYHIIGKQRAIGQFKRKAIGDNSEEYLKDLVKEIKLKYFNLKLENEREFNRVSNAFIVREFSAIEKKLKNNEYKTFHEFERDIKFFQAFFLENGPNGPNKRLIINEFLQKALVDGANHYLKLNSNETVIQQRLYQDAKLKLDQEITELRNENMKEKQTYSAKLAQLEYEKSELELKEKSLKNSLSQWKELKENEELELKKELQTEKGIAQRSVQEYKDKFTQAEESLKEMERKLYLSNSEHDKQMALLKQRLEYFENLTEQSTSKEKDLALEIKNLKKEHLNQMKESSNKYEELNKEFRTKFDQQLQKILDLENDLSTKEQKFESERKKWKENEFNSQKSLEEAKGIIQKLQKELGEKGDIQIKKYDEYREQAEKKLGIFTEKVNSLEQNIKDKDELLKTLQNAYEKEKSVLSQKVEFLTLQITESKEQYNELKKAYDTTLECFERDNQTSSKEESNKIKELKELHQIEIQKAQLENENIKKQLNKQTESLTEKNQELELQFKLKSCEFTQELESLKQTLERVESEKQQLIKQLKALDENKLKIITEVDEQYSQRIRAFEEETEEQRISSERRLRETQEKFEENLAQIKTFYEAERERLERRILEEKEKSDRKLNNVVEEYETKIKEDQTLHEEEIDELKGEIQELGMKNSALIQEYEIELTLKNQNIESLEGHLKELKENYSNLQLSNNSALENQLNNFTSERNGLLSKIESLNTELSKKNQEILALSQAKHYIESTSVKKEAILETSTRELAEGKLLLSQSLEELRAKYQELHQAFIEKKAEYNKEIALTKQQNEFLIAKTQDLQKQILDMANLHEEKLKMQKEELGQKFKEEQERINLEKTIVVTEYEKLKKVLSNLEHNHKEQILSLEKENLVLQEKYNNLEETTKNQIKKLMKENQTLLNQLHQSKEKHASEKALINEELQKLRIEHQDIEHKYNELMINYEKEQVLWKGKFQFLELQKEEAKKDLTDTQRKLELTLQQIQKKRNMEAQEAEIHSNSKINALEKKYQFQLEEVNANHEKEILEYQEKIKKLEREIKNLNEKSTIDIRNTQGSQIYIEKKFMEKEENEKRLQIDLENVKAERDLKILEHQKILDKERSSLKSKILEYEVKLRELENRKNMQVFEHEKEKAKWQLEKDHLLSHNNELQEALNTIEKKKDSLLRENEKLKSETKASKKSMTITGNLNNFLYNKGSFTAVKVKPTSPRGSRDSPGSIDKNLIDITNKKYQFNGNNTGLVSRRTGSTCEDELQF